MNSLVEVIAILSPLAALIFGYATFARNRKHDDKHEATQTATILTKLENISDNIKDIKYEITNVKQNVSEMSERLVLVEASAQSAHKRIDELRK